MVREADDVGVRFQVLAEVELFGRDGVEVGDAPQLVADRRPARADEFRGQFRPGHWLRFVGQVRGTGRPRKSTVAILRFRERAPVYSQTVYSQRSYIASTGTSSTHSPPNWTPASSDPPAST